CLRVDVESGGLRGPELQGGESENPGPAAVVEYALTAGNSAVEPFEAHRGGRMRAGAEGETRVELEHDGRRPIGPLACGTDPEATAEPHRSKILEPLPLPGAIIN